MKISSSFSIIFTLFLCLSCTYTPSKIVKYRAQDVLVSSKAKTPPRIIITSPPIESTGDVGTAEINSNFSIKGIVIDDGPIKSLKINRKEVIPGSDGSFSFNGRIDEGINEFALVAADSNGNVAREVIKIRGNKKQLYIAERIEDQKSFSKPALWVLAIGVSKYKNPKIDLKFADNDALSISSALKKNEVGSIFSEVHTETLINENATRGNILTEMSRHLGKAAPNDVVLIFVAGHGVKNVQTGSYYFLPHNADARNLLFEGLKWSDFDEAIKIISSNVNKVVLILDTCHSGAINVAMRNLNAGEDLAAKMKASTGLYVLSASKAGEVSIEKSMLKFSGEKPGHGAFTYALLKGIRGEANFDKNSYLSINELFSYVAAEVPRITNGQQHPYSKIEGTDLPIVSFDHTDINEVTRANDQPQNYNAPPQLNIILNKTTVECDTPIVFRYSSSDKEGDSVRVLKWEFGDGESSILEQPEHAFAKWSGLEKEHQFVVTLKATDGHNIVTAEKAINVKKQERIKMLTVNGVSFKMVHIPAGDFIMGSPPSESGRGADEEQHPVLVKSFWMGEKEVTQGLWRAIMGNNPAHFTSCGDNCPVESVNWNDCKAFSQKLNTLVSGWVFRLPTEAEWEYTCRAGTKTKFSWGNQADCSKANYGNGKSADCEGTNPKQTMEVGSFAPNPWELCDMHGNVWEWVEDWYSDYPSNTTTDPKKIVRSGRVIRGGSWFNAAGLCRSALRRAAGPGSTYSGLGFRLAGTH